MISGNANGMPLVSKLGADKSIYASVGVRPLINARGTVTIVGATRMLPEVKEAMDAATHDYVQLDELMTVSEADLRNSREPNGAA